MTDKLFEARLGDMADRCERKGMAVFSGFLDERQCAEAEQWCRNNCGGMRYMLWQKQSLLLTWLIATNIQPL